MQRKTYSPEFKEQALRKAHERGAKTLASIANELNLPLGSLKNWLKESNKSGGTNAPTSGPAANWTAAQRLSALTESHGLKDQALHAWCRERGLFEHQLQQWRTQFCAIDKPLVTPQDGALRQAKQKNDQLERELRRKDKALAEAAALLVLQKKFQALWEGEEK
ncbi:MAG: transposase [Thiomonas sp.]|jgi:transposase-like protein|nr:transposase [Thiomonas sp.]